MENSIKFTLAIDNLNKKIAELNIRISKDLDNETLKNELSALLEDKSRLFKETDVNELKKLIEKYGSKE